MPITRRTILRSALLAGGAAAAVGAVTSCATRGERPAEQRYPPLGDVVEVPGARLHVLDRPGPSPEAPTVVLIHGASGNLRDFAFDFIDRLTPQHRVVAIDRPGLGHSSRGAVEDPHRPDVQARLMRAAAKAVGVDRAILVGHSWGAAPALSWALDDPESVAGVVSLAGATHPFPGSVGLLYELGASPIFGGATAVVARTFFSEAAAKNAVARIFAPQTAPEGYIDYVGVGLALRYETLRDNAEDLANLNAFLTVQRQRYAAIAAPIEIVHGDADDVVGIEVHGARLVEDAPNARLTRLDGVGHMPHHADPGACIAAINRIAAIDRA